MSKRNRKVIGVIIGLAIFFIGWSVRSTVPLTGFHNKPIGGIVMAAGMFISGIFAYKLLKR